jgi:acetamidase/formamidase
MSRCRTIHQSHLGWDNSLEPAARIAPGEILQFDVLDAGGGQLSPTSTVEEVSRMDFGTAIESPMRVALKFDLIEQTPLAFPRFHTAGPVTRHLDSKGYDVATGIGPD